MSANDKQVDGNHYKKFGSFQHWDMVQHFDLDAFQYQITKYVMRWKDKMGLNDLRKAQHFIEKYIEIHEALNTKGKVEKELQDNHELLVKESDNAIRTLNRVIDRQRKVIESMSKQLETKAVMQHQSTPYFSFEGIKENQALWRCRICRAFLELYLNEHPESVHDYTKCDSSEATPAYVDQARDDLLNAGHKMYAGDTVRVKYLYGTFEEIPSHETHTGDTILAPYRYGSVEVKVK